MRSNERDANEALATGAVHSIARTMARESTREDWRAVLAKRDERAAERRNIRTQRHSHVRNTGRARVAVIVVQAFAAACVAIIARLS
jgi:hypothetical protein